jgi:peptidoglycan/xylan/chitin deacetylase (PgdA/CDA1 family)
MALPIVSHGPAAGARVALTFDDGPSTATPLVLAALAAFDARATFFVLGTSLDRGPEFAALARSAADAGHELGNHTYAHPHLAELGDDAVCDELERAAARLEAVVGIRPELVRGPYREDEERVARLAATLGARAVVHWSVDPEDWDAPPPEAIAERVLAAIEPGAIVVLHDFETREGTAEALRTILPELRARGLEPVTVSELLGLDG